MSASALRRALRICSQRRHRVPAVSLRQLIQRRVGIRLAENITRPLPQVSRSEARPEGHHMPDLGYEVEVYGGGEFSNSGWRMDHTPYVVTVPYYIEHYDEDIKVRPLGHDRPIECTV